MSRYYGDRDCPTNSRDAYWEGRQSREYDRNPYQHGNEYGASRDCEEAYSEFKRGQRMAEYAREEQAEQERLEERRQERMAAERRHQEQLEEQQQQEIQQEEQS